MKARYIRVSTNNQSTLRQDIKSQPDEVPYTDKGVSGAVPFDKRPAGKKLLAAAFAKHITELHVSDLSRLGRDTLDILTTIDRLHRYGVNIHVDDLNGLKSLNTDGTPNQMFSFITTVMSGISQMERENIRDRVKQGIQAKKDKNEFVPGGRPKGTTKNDSEILKRYPKAVKMLTEYPEMKQKDVAGACEVDARTIKKLRDILKKQKSSL